MNKIWCPYTGQWHERQNTTKEHIIPLSCGGHNNFSIRVERQTNSTLGSRLDSKLTGHPLIASARRHYELLGQSHKSPTVEWPVIYKGLQGKLNLSENTPLVKTYRSKNKYGINLSKYPYPDENLTSKFSFDLNLVLSFGCKLALGTSYFLFGQDF